MSDYNPETDPNALLVKAYGPGPDDRDAKIAALEKRVRRLENKRPQMACLRCKGSGKEPGLHNQCGRCRGWGVET